MHGCWIGRLAIWVKLPALAPAYLPVMMNRAVAMSAIAHLQTPYDLLASPIKSAGLRVVVVARLRVKDIGFVTQMIILRDEKGAQDRTTLLPNQLLERLHQRIELICARGQTQDVFFQAPVALLFALKCKYPADQSLGAMAAAALL
jgi:integrase